MSKYTNTGAGARGINVKVSKDNDGTETTWIEPGATVEIDDALISDKTLPDGIKKGDAAAKDAAKAATDQAAADAAAAS